MFYWIKESPVDSSPSLHASSSLSRGPLLDDPCKFHLVLLVTRYILSSSFNQPAMVVKNEKGEKSFKEHCWSNTGTLWRMKIKPSIQNNKMNLTSSQSFDCNHGMFIKKICHILCVIIKNLIFIVLYQVIHNFIYFLRCQGLPHCFGLLFCCSFPGIVKTISIPHANAP